MADLTRHQMYGLIHKGAFLLPGISSDDDYRDWLQNQTRTDKTSGKRSCIQCTNAQLKHLVILLQHHGALDGKSRGGKGIDRPTSRQWSKIAAMARERGWEKGLNDERLQGFIKRTANVSHSRFLTREGATKCINGLEKWQAQAR